MATTPQSRQMNATTGMNGATGEQERFTGAMEALFHPKRVAIVGATPRPGFAYNIHRLLLNNGYEGDVVGVTPRHQEVLGSLCYPTLEAVPGKVDLAMVVVPSNLVLDVLGQAERAGVGAVNIITSGFGEQSDEEAHQRQDQVRDFARRTGIRVVGPNCLGLISTPAKLVAKSGAYANVRRGPIGIIFQSGLLAYSVVIPPLEREFGYSYVITTGNEADLDATDFMRYYIEDDETRVIGCFIEQFRDPQKFLRVAEMAAERQKPLVVLKIGRSEAGKRAAQAHTGSLVGSDAIADAIMRQYGIVRVYNLDEMIETLAAFHSKRLPKGPGLGTIFVSGGACGLVADLSQDLGISLPQLAPETVAKLKPSSRSTARSATRSTRPGRRRRSRRSSRARSSRWPRTRISTPSSTGRRIRAAWIWRPRSAKCSGRCRSASRTRSSSSCRSSRAECRMAAGYDQDPVEPTMHWDGVPFLQGMENGLRAVRALIRYAEFQRMRQAGKRPAGRSERDGGAGAGTRRRRERQAARRARREGSARALRHPGDARAAGDERGRSGRGGAGDRLPGRA